MDCKDTGKLPCGYTKFCEDYHKYIEKNKSLVLLIEAWNHYWNWLEWSYNEDFEWRNRRKNTSIFICCHITLFTVFICRILIGLNNGILPSELDKNIDEERRICYVSITRAKEVLYLSSSRKNYFQGKRKVLNPSTFIRKWNML